jgi:hypothetical protein
MPAAAAEMPVKPKSAATSDTTRKNSANLSIPHLRRAPVATDILRNSGAAGRNFVSHRGAAATKFEPTN